MTRTWVARLVAVALLAAWQACLLHPLAHVDEQGQFVHLNGADGGDTRGENDHDGDPSDRLGDSLAALIACAAGTPQLLRPEQLEHHATASAFQGAPRVAQAPPFLSHAPPASA